MQSAKASHLGIIEFFLHGGCAGGQVGRSVLDEVLQPLNLLVHHVIQVVIAENKHQDTVTQSPGSPCHPGGHC